MRKTYWFGDYIKKHKIMGLDGDINADSRV